MQEDLICRPLLILEPKRPSRVNNHNNSNGIINNDFLFCFQPCHVVYTDFRPTPLQHYIYPSGGDGLHLVVDEKVLYVDFNEAGFA